MVQDDLRLGVEVAARYDGMRLISDGPQDQGGGTLGLDL
jgi:hypothetical protein